jgi:acyl transferase domain-containing protein
MGLDLLRSEPLVRARLERCDRAFRPLAGWSIVEELVAGDRWADIEVALPCLAALGIAVADLWRSWGIEPSAAVGHSAGEIAAAYTAGVLTLEEAMLVSVHYSRALGKIQGTGGMGVVGLPPEETAARIAEDGRRLTVAGWLSPVSATVAGDAAEVDAFLLGLSGQGVFAARVALLDVAAHTPEVLPHQAALREALARLAPRPPAIPLVSTVAGETLDRPMDADYWAENLFRPVLFSRAVERLLASGERLFLEIDAHPILATPLEQGFAAAGVRGTVLASLRRGEDAHEVLAGSLAALGGMRERSERMEVIPLSARSPEALRDLAMQTARIEEESRGDLTPRPPLPSPTRPYPGRGGATSQDAETMEGGGSPSPGGGWVEDGRGGQGVRSLRDLAWTAAVRRSHHEHRLAVVARSRTELAERLVAFARGEAVPGIASGRKARGAPGEAGGLVFVFSGQGPQWPGMGRQLFEIEPVFRRVVERCDEALRPLLGYSFRERMEAEDDALSHTEVAQTAIYALQAGLAALWREWGVVPDAVVGHSVGEVAAAHASGALSLEEGAIVAACRGRAMEPARGLGGMAALELPAAEVEPLLADLDLSVAAVNSPASTTVAGAPEALDELARRLGGLGLTCRRLRVEYAFHTAQMDPCVRELQPLLAELRPRAVATPMVSSVTGEPVAGPDLDAGYWCANVRRPVRFAEALAGLAGNTVFLEVGPHPVLSVAVAQTLPEAAVLASLRRGRDERETLLETLGSLWVLGQAIDWPGVHPDGGRQVRLPTYPFQRQRYWFEGRVKAPQVAAPAPQPAEDDVFAERLLAEQLDAFNRMVALQLDVLGRGSL